MEEDTVVLTFSTYMETVEKELAEYDKETATTPKEFIVGLVNTMKEYEEEFGDYMLINVFDRTIFDASTIRKVNATDEFGFIKHIAETNGYEIVKPNNFNLVRSIKGVIAVVDGQGKFFGTITIEEFFSGNSNYCTISSENFFICFRKGNGSGMPFYIFGPPKEIAYN